jgi:deoxyribodipyrimidine photo-lyase
LPLTALQSLIARLHWRGHFMQKLESEPELEEHSFHPLHESARMPTRRDDAALEAWATGQTGIPFIDACMRSLIATGWLNFRMRAMLQSFASYQLGLDWRASGERLARLFTDYEPGIHWPQVQMQSGQTGINTPRIYNPVKQARDQDPDGVFTRRWVPELEGGGYRSPIVDPADAARAARARLTAVRQTAGYREAAHEVYLRHGSRGRRLEQRGERRGRGRGAEATTERSGQMGLFDANPNGTA